MRESNVNHMYVMVRTWLLDVDEVVTLPAINELVVVPVVPHASKRLPPPEVAAEQVGVV